MRTRSSLALQWLGSAASTFDRALVQAARWSAQRSGGSRAERLPHEERLARLADVQAVYGQPSFVSEPHTFFIPPEPASPSLELVRGFDGGRVYDASWPSNFHPIAGPFHDRYVRHETNRTAYARLYLSDVPRPLVILVHGYLSGQYAIEERAFPVRWILRRGFDVALFVLPFHYKRARTDKRAPPPFPGADPRYTVEGCRQAVHDIRSLVAYLRGRGYEDVGIMGMSLGGYTTALLATLEASLAFAIPIIPLSSFADFAMDQGRFGSGAVAAEEYAAYDRAVRAISPFARPCAVPASRVLVLAAMHDNITPKRHAEKLAAHFGANLVVFDGGHLLQFGRAEAFRAIGRFWAAHGFRR